jgi:hypothetical protein
MRLSYPPASPIFPGSRTTPTTYYPPATVCPGSTTGAMTADRVMYMPALYPGLTIDRLRVNVTTGAAGLCRLGIYHNNNGLPGTLLVDAGAVDTTNIATVDASFTALTLPNDWVWFTATFNATPTMTIGTASLDSTILGCENVTTPRRALFATKTYAALSAAADLTSLAWGSNAPVLLAFKS